MGMYARIFKSKKIYIFMVGFMNLVCSMACITLPKAVEVCNSSDFIFVELI